MGWEETCAVEERMRFVVAVQKARNRLRLYAGGSG
jgi:hypothetical protein